MRHYVNEHSDRIFAPALKAGDVLFWNSRTIHGALPTIDSRFSRKSLTGHYLPSEYAFGNLFVRKDSIKYRDFNGVQYYRNQPDYSFVNKFKFRVKTSVYNSPIMLKIMRAIQKFLN
jgi:phytanoyl-CoA hydroxylase